jgi:hypothetical protein
MSQFSAGMTLKYGMFRDPCRYQLLENGATLCSKCAPRKRGFIVQWGLTIRCLKCDSACRDLRPASELSCWGGSRFTGYVLLRDAVACPSDLPATSVAFCRRQEAKPTCPTFLMGASLFLYTGC